MRDAAFSAATAPTQRRHVRRGGAARRGLTAKLVGGQLPFRICCRIWHTVHVVENRISVCGYLRTGLARCQIRPPVQFRLPSTINWSQCWPAIVFQQSGRCGHTGTVLVESTVVGVQIAQCLRYGGVRGEQAQRGINGDVHAEFAEFGQRQPRRHSACYLVEQQRFRAHPRTHLADEVYRADAVDQHDIGIGIGQGLCSVQHLAFIDRIGSRHHQQVGAHLKYCVEFGEVLAAVLAWQLWLNHYVPLVYWLTVVVVSVTGTLYNLSPSHRSTMARIAVTICALVMEVTFVQVTGEAGQSRDDRALASVIRLGPGVRM